MTTLENAIKAYQGMIFVVGDLYQLQSDANMMVSLHAEQLHVRAIELRRDLQRFADAIEAHEA